MHLKAIECCLRKKCFAGLKKKLLILKNIIILFENRAKNQTIFN
jgi:hypothetical protein